MSYQNTVWILMHKTVDEKYIQSFDHPFPWSTKKAALRKIAQLEENGLTAGFYVPVKFVRAK